MEQNGNTYLCAQNEVPALLKRAEEQKSKVLKDFSLVFRGNIDVRIHEAKHVRGWSIAGTLMVNGKPVLEYDPVDLCFLDLNEMVFQRTLELRLASGGKIQEDPDK